MKSNQIVQENIHTKDLHLNIDKNIQISGWLAKRIRPSKNILFWLLRDGFGTCQLVFKSDDKFFEIANNLTKETVVKVFGLVKVKNSSSTNTQKKVLTYEINVSNLLVINHSDTVPFLITDDTDGSEKLRLTYRYLDLRRPIMQKQLHLRNNLLHIIRDYFWKTNYIFEVETPILASPTIEGARNFLVEITHKPGYFFALPQSPQIYKQLLMAGGLSGYYQIARCFRDEKPRNDRQPEFSQLDCEIPFINCEQIMNLLEKLIIQIWKKTLNEEISFNFPRITYQEALEKYGCDKPDLRFELFLNDYSFLMTKNNHEEIVFQGILFDKSLSNQTWTQIVSAIKKVTNQDLYYYFRNEKNILQTNLSSDNQEKLLNHQNDLNGWIGFNGSLNVARTVLSQVRNLLGKYLQLTTDQPTKFCWIIDYPMFEYSSTQNKYLSSHHPFCQPQNSKEFLINWKNSLATSYDLVVNGVELASGSERIYQKNVQNKVFDILKLDQKTIEKEFGYFINAMNYGFPNHAGFGLGIDRLLMVLTNTESIREVIAFPKTSKFTSLLSKTPKKIIKTS